MSYEQRRLVEAARGALERAGRTFEGLSHAQQHRLANSLGVTTPDMHRLMVEQRSAAPSRRSTRPPRRLTAAEKTARRQELNAVRDATAPVVEQQLTDLDSREWDAVLLVEHKLGLTPSGTRYETQARVYGAVRGMLKRSLADSTLFTDVEHDRLRHYERMLVQGANADMKRRNASDAAIAGLHRQRAAVGRAV